MTDSDDLANALPASVVALVDSKETTVVKGKFIDFKTLRNAHTIVGLYALQVGEVLAAMSARAIGQDFVQEVTDGAVPEISEGNEPDNDTELTVTLTIGTFTSVMSSLALLKQQNLFANPDVPKEVEGAKRVEETWAVFTPQMRALAPEFGAGL